jgi:acyl carrier protein
MNVHETVRNFILSELRFSGTADDLTDDFQLLENEVLDSMGLYELITFLENTFGITIDDDEILPDNFSTIGCIALLVEAKV